MLQPGQIVTGVVTRREPFGVFVDVAESEPGALLVDAITDGDPSTTMADLPEVGDHVEAVFLAKGIDLRQVRAGRRCKYAQGEYCRIVTYGHFHLRHLVRDTQGTEHS